MKTIFMVGLLVAWIGGIAYGDTNLIGVGEWSQTVNDSDGYGLRGRLLVYHAAVRNRGGFTDLARVYLELEHPFVDAWRNPIEISYSVGRDVQLFLQDGTGRSISAEPYATRGPPQIPFWVTVPCDSSIRLRADFYTLTSSTSWHTGLSIMSTGMWNLALPGTNDYFLSGTFRPSTNQSNRLNYHTWQGTLQLPKVRIADQRNENAQPQHAVDRNQPSPSSAIPPPLPAGSRR
jgi:hypothetical protein